MIVNAYRNYWRLSCLAKGNRMVELQLRILGTGLGGIQVPLTLRDGSIHTSKRLLQMGGKKAEKEPVRWALEKSKL